MTKTASQIFEEADKILANCFFVVDPCEHLSRDKKGEYEYADEPTGYKHAPKDGGLGRSESRQATREIVEVADQTPRFDAEAARNKMRRLDREERIAVYREQKAFGEDIEFLPRVDFSHGQRRNDSYTSTRDM